MDRAGKISEVRAMEQACGILHQVRQSNGGNVMYYGDIDALITAVENVHERMKNDLRA